jgi:Na+/H+ antiporter NhaA
MKLKRFLSILAIVASLLLIPLVAMLFTTEVNWTASDFIIMGLLLTTAATAIDFAWRKLKTFRYRWVVCGVILFVFFLIYAELAVGIFGSPLAGS